MRRVLVAIAVMACGSSKPKPPPDPEPQHEQVKDLGLRGDVAKPLHYVIRQSGRKVGTYDITTTGKDVRYDEKVLENGRGPEVEASFHLASDGTPDHYKATGHHEMGAPATEAFSRSGAKGTWTSAEEHGSSDATGPTFYVWIADGWLEPWLVPAALRNGGSIALGPGGEAKIQKVAEDASPGFSVVQEGAAAATIDAVATKVQDLMRARGDDIAHTTAHRPPPAGYAYTHARVLDVARGAWVADQTVLVVGDKKNGGKRK